MMRIQPDTSTNCLIYKESRMARRLVLVSLALLISFSLACRTKTAVKAEPQAPAPPPPPPAVEKPTQVEPPQDFVPEQPVEVEDLSGDIAELNRRAQARGWIRDAFFAFDSSALSPEAQDNLAISAAWLKGHPEFNLVVEGHCDERGTEQYNLALGEKRASSARDYLVTLGVQSARVKTVSFGEERPFDPGQNEAAWAKNRRAHLVLVRR